ncbi:MAG: TRAP transporter small permease [Thermodesulfobacteriota bacterium]
MGLSRLAAFLNGIAGPVSRAMSVIGAGVLAGLMFLAAMDVLLRYVFNRPISGALELIQYMMVITVVSGFALCTVEKSHIRVEVLIGRCPPKVQTLLYGLTSFLSLGLIGLLTWQSAVYAVLLHDAKMTSPVLFIPAFPFAIIQAVAMAVFCVALLAEFLHFLSKALNEGAN